MNGSRGSVIFTAADKEVRVLFTNRSLADIEATLNKSIIEIARGLDDGHTGIRDVAVILRNGMEASRRDSRDGGRSVTLDDAYAVLDELGFASVVSIVIPAVVEMLTPKTEDDDPN